jgi:hypothetical protein
LGGNFAGYVPIEFRRALVCSGCHCIPSRVTGVIVCRPIFFFGIKVVSVNQNIRVDKCLIAHAVVPGWRESLLQNGNSVEECNRLSPGLFVSLLFANKAFDQLREQAADRSTTSGSQNPGSLSTLRAMLMVRFCFCDCAKQSFRQS